ncbi:MAG: Bax inhibitor-1/YccA family protein [Burkholderiaceae bacterium]|jgi:modulator of FtsH protease|nr:Bax inhibitor-1/YccA family protein [Burkholderiaceae bacterium]
MNNRLQTLSYPGAADGGLASQQRNKVLRNTYWLLAISLIPTVLGAWIGVSTGVVTAMSPGVSLAVFLIGAFGLMFVINKTKDSAAGVAALLAFTFFMGLMLSRLLAMVLGMKNGGTLVMTAFGGTAAIFFGMASMATVIKRDLSGLGKFLMVGAWMLFFAFIANFFLQSSALMLTLLVICLGLFSAYMLYDVKRIIDGGETNYITATLALYLDIYNVFQSLLALLGIFGGSND